MGEKMSDFSSMKMNIVMIWKGRIYQVMFWQIRQWTIWYFHVTIIFTIPETHHQATTTTEIFFSKTTYSCFPLCHALVIKKKRRITLSLSSLYDYAHHLSPTIIIKYELGLFNYHVELIRLDHY